MTYAVAALVDIDDYIASEQAQGLVWARGQLERTARAVNAATGGRAQARPPEEWLVLLSGPDPDALMSEAVVLAEEVRARIVRETAWTATVSLSPPSLGGGAAEREARRINDLKLVLGGDRVITPAPPYRGQSLTPPVRIEQELTRRVQAGDRNGAAGLLASWVDRCAGEPGVDPQTLRSWLIGQLLFVVDAVNTTRLADGSTDWVRACARLPVEDIIVVGDIHERSYLHIWLRETLGRLMPAPSRHDILAVAEAYLAQHFADPGLRLATVAAAVSASPFYISHLFAEERGTTFLRHLTGLRLRHARKLLATTDRPVDEVAARSGYSSAKALRGVFQRHVGCSPTEYRRQRAR
ncbi:MAG: helix-turn-helix protein [Nonomuraea muscovyensis]|uniref:AraC-like DNA-binding protein n=1 Tax=Nonomuraea muscovyensis TaxID=1124761 RepID=A0A7X0BVN3_9ACTN|nr:helix-turn-helix transcriptional regulator [Nonomuraea muscovyensis]MBB6343749.1 AraC-like DNA-binding protein [Nonomuraea muscovyensis]MDF2704596.1 helix-turn-helix protein [Nonomuraea muscovyensis]